MLLTEQKLKEHKPKAIKCLFTGYADMHSPHTYRFYNPITRSIILLSRDVRWDAWNTVNPKLSMSSHRVQSLHDLLEKSHLASNEKDVIDSLLNHYVNKSFIQHGGQIQDIENQEHGNQEEEEFDYGNIDHEDFEIENPMFQSDSNDDKVEVEVEEEESDIPSLSDEKIIEEELEENQEDLDQGYEDEEGDKNDEGDEIDEHDEVVQQQKQNKGRMQRELQGLGVVNPESIPREVQKLHTSYNQT
jgi:hypothetical protein